jgi:hypothetical protein
MFVQIFGSLCVLVPFVLVQLGRMSSTSPWYGWLNLIGSTVLAFEAMIGRDWGFLLLESVWALVSLRSLMRSRSGDAEVPADHASITVDE